MTGWGTLSLRWVRRLSRPDVVTQILRETVLPLFCFRHHRSFEPYVGSLHALATLERWYIQGACKPLMGVAGEAKDCKRRFWALASFWPWSMCQIVHRVRAEHVTNPSQSCMTPHCGDCKALMRFIRSSWQSFLVSWDRGAAVGLCRPWKSWWICAGSWAPFFKAGVWSLGGLGVRNLI